LCRITWIENDRHAGRAGRGIFEQFEPFSPDRIFESGEPGNVAARAHQAFDKAELDRITNTIGSERVSRLSAIKARPVAAKIISGAAPTRSAE
jgi:hypothetical protein